VSPLCYPTLALVFHAHLMDRWPIRWGPGQHEFFTAKSWVCHQWWYRWTSCM